MNKKVRNAGIVIGIILVGIQFIRPSVDNPPVDPAKDFVNIEKAPENVRVMLKKSCYDCHSNQTYYPWYNQIAPVSWYLADHINDGRRHLNFSTWSEFPENRKNRRLNQSARLVRSGKMPLWDYKLVHPESDLTEQEKNELAEWFEKISPKYPVNNTNQKRPENS